MAVQCALYIGRAFLFVLRITTSCARVSSVSPPRFSTFFNVYCAFKSVEIHWTGNSLPPIVSCPRLPTDSRLAEVIYGRFLWYAYILRCKLFDWINCAEFYNNMIAPLAIFLSWWIYILGGSIVFPRCPIHMAQENLVTQPAVV